MTTSVSVHLVGKGMKGSVDGVHLEFLSYESSESIIHKLHLSLVRSIDDKTVDVHIQILPNIGKQKVQRFFCKDHKPQVSRIIEEYIRTTVEKMFG